MNPMSSRRKTTCALATVVLCCLAGCSSNTYHTPDIISYDPDLVTVDMKKKQINPWAYKAFSNGQSLYAQAADVKADTGAAKAARNRLQSAILTLSDLVTEEHLAKVFATEDTTNIGLGITALSLSAIGTAVSPVTTKTALSAGAGMAEGSRAIINEELYSNAFAPEISKAIRAARRAENLRLEIKRNDKPIQDYNVDDAIHDALYYHQMGSFYYGLELVQKATQRAVAKIDEDEIAPLEKKTNPKASESEDERLAARLTELLTKPLKSDQADPDNPEKFYTTTIDYANFLAKRIDRDMTLTDIHFNGGEKLRKLVEALERVVKLEK